MLFMQQAYYSLINVTFFNVDLERLKLHQRYLCPTVIIHSMKQPPLNTLVIGLEKMGSTIVIILTFKYPPPVNYYCGGSQNAK